MGAQNSSVQRTAMQNKILDLEKKYFKILENVFLSDSFVEDLLIMEKEIREN